MRPGVKILWICVFAFTICLILFTTFNNYETMSDQCYDPAACSKFVGELYTGYETSLVQSVAQENAKSEIAHFCQSKNGGYEVIDNLPNYTLNATNHTFLCKDPRRPESTMSNIDDRLTVTSSYDSTIQFSKNDFETDGSPDLLTEISDYCQSITGDIGNKQATNYIIDENNNILCKSQFDPALVVTTTPSKAVWEPNHSQHAKNLSEVEKKCIALNGNHSTLTDASTNRPKALYSISQKDGAIVYNCNSYWTGDPITSKTQEKSAIKDVKTYGYPRASFSKLEDITNFCKTHTSILPFLNKKIITTNNKKYSFECISALDNLPVTAAEIRQNGYATYALDSEKIIKFNTTTALTSFCNGPFKIMRTNPNKLEFTCDTPPSS